MYFLAENVKNCNIEAKWIEMPIQDWLLPQICFTLLKILVNLGLGLGILV